MTNPIEIAQADRPETKDAEGVPDPPAGEAARDLEKEYRDSLVRIFRALGMPGCAGLPVGSRLIGARLDGPHSSVVFTFESPLGVDGEEILVHIHTDLKAALPTHVPIRGGDAFVTGGRTAPQGDLAALNGKALRECADLIYLPDDLPDDELREKVVAAVEDLVTKAEQGM